MQDIVKYLLDKACTDSFAATLTARTGDEAKLAMASAGLPSVPA